MLTRTVRKPWLDRRLPAEHESHQHVDAVTIDLAVRHDDLLLLDPRALDVLERFVGPGDSFLDRVLKALRGSRRQFDDFGDRHDQTSCAGSPTYQGSIAHFRSAAFALPRLGLGTPGTLAVAPRGFFTSASADIANVIQRLHKSR